MQSLALALLAVFLLNSLPQQQQTASPKHVPPEEVSEDDIVRVDTTLVGVPVTVTDGEGRFVSGLRQEDFHIYEDGVEQKISYFAPLESNVTVLLLFDNRIAKNFIRNYRRTAKAFAEQLSAGDKILVAKFGDSKYEVFKKAGETPAGVQQEERAVKWRFGRGIHDAIDAAIRRMNTIEGRKAIVLFSDGMYHPDSITISEAPGGKLLSMSTTKPEEHATAMGTINEAAKSDAPFYVMQYDTMTEAQKRGPTPQNHESFNALIVLFRNEHLIADAYLHALTENSGGRLYPVVPDLRKGKTDDPPSFAQSFAQIAAELRQQYSLGYYPKKSDTASLPHQISVRVDKPGLLVRSRTSYAPMPAKP